MKKIVGLIVAVLLLFGVGLADTLMLPSALKIIDVEAFYEDTSLDEVVLPDGIKEIRSRAFAKSSLKKISLPESITFIAEDAFEDTEIMDFTVICSSTDDYVYEWAYNHSYIGYYPAIETQPQSVFAAVGDEVSFTVAATGINPTYDWQYSTDRENWVSTGGTAPTYTFTVTEENKDYTYHCVISDGSQKSTSNIVSAKVSAYRLPINITLDQNGVLSFNITETKPHTIMLGVYGAKAPVSSFSLFSTAYADGSDLLAVIPIEISDGQTSESINIGNFFTATGDYHVVAKAVGSADEENARDMGIGRTASSNVIYFTRPSVSLSTPVNIRWGTGFAYARAMWDPVEDTASYQVMLYSGEDIVASRNINTTYFDFSSGWVDFSSITANQYTFTVTALSADITQVSSSDESAHSALLSEPDQTNAVAIVTQPASKYVAQNSSAAISISASGIGLTYQWYVDEEAVGHEDDVSINLDTAQLGEQLVRCVVTDAFGNSLNSAVATITVLDDSPVDHIITTQPESKTVDPDGKAVYFTVVHSLPNYYRIEYTWYRSEDGETWTEFTQHRDYITYNAYPDNNGMQFKCVVKATSPTGTVICEETSDIATLTVNHLPIAITSDLDLEYWTDGERYAYIGASADEELTYQWYVNGQPSPGATMSQFPLSLITAESSLYCTLTAGEFTKNSRVATVHYGGNPATRVEILTQTGRDLQHLVVGDLFTFKAALAPTKCTSSVSWSSSNPGVATVNAYGIVETVGFGSAVITAETDNHITATVSLTVDSYKVTYDPVGGRFQDGSTSNLIERVVSGQAAELPVVFLEGDTFLGWTLNDTVVTALTPTEDVILYASWEKSTQEEDEDIAIVQDMAAIQYAKIGEDAEFSIVTNGAKVRSYEWKVSMDGGQTWAKYDDGVADGRKTKLIVPATEENNGWQFKVAVTGYRYGTVVESTACTLTTGYGDNPPQTETFSFTLQPYSITRNSGTTAEFTVAVDAEEATYQWQKDGINISGATSATLTIPAVAGTDVGSYACSVTVGDSTKTSASATLTVEEIRIVTQPTGKTITAGASETLTVAATPDGVTYTWERKNGNSWITEATGASLDLSGLTAGTYTFCVIVSREGFTPVTSNEATVQVEEARYIVTYDANGGAFGSVQTFEVVTAGGAYTIDAYVVALPAREGYEFTGWTIDGEPVEGNTLEISADVTLMASWKEIKYSVTYDAGEGVFSDHENTLTVENVKGEYQITDQSPTREGYIFNGWKLNGQTVSGTITVTSNITLIADWTEIKYSVTYNATPGTINGDAVFTVENIKGDYTLINDVPIRDGFSFVGWKLNGMLIQENTIDVAGNITLVAEWSALPTYTVTYNAAPGSFDSGTTITVSGARGEHTLISTVPSRTGYKFSGWMLNGQAVEDTIEVYSDVTLTADWSEILYSVTYSAEPGFFADERSTWTFGNIKGTYSLIDTCPTREGYTFNGWKLNGTLIQENTIDVTEDITLTASWLENQNPVITANLANEYYPTEGGQGFVVQATGIDLHYQWQTKMPDGDWTDVADNDSNTYAPLLNASHDEMQIHCIITDRGYSPATSTTSTTATFRWIIPATSVEVEKVSGEELHIVGDELMFQAVITPANSTDTSITWTSSNTDVAIVDSTGKVTIVGRGNAQITAKAGEITSSPYNLTVNHVLVTYNADGGTVNPTTVRAELGEFTPTANPVKDNYSFNGWMLNGEIVQSLSLTDNIELTASWTEIPVRTLSVSMENKTEIDGRTVTFNPNVAWIVGEGTEEATETKTYQWQVYEDGEWTVIEGISGSPTYSFAVSSAMNGKHYKVIVTCDGQEASAEAVLTVEPKLAFSTDIDSTMTVDAGETVTLTVAANKEGASYQWYEDNDPMAGETGTTLTFTATTEMNNHLFHCIATRDDDEATSNHLTLTVETPIIQPESVAISVDSDYWSIDTSMMSGTVNNYIYCEIAGGTGDMEYHWLVREEYDNEFTETGVFVRDELIPDGNTYYCDPMMMTDWYSGYYYFKLDVNGVESEEVKVYIDIIGGGEGYWCDMCQTWHMSPEECPMMGGGGPDDPENPNMP